jgi:sulfite reductase (NADPH) hemoprotein beta-component
MSLSVISANRLSDGVAVWLGPDGDWVDRIAGAWTLDDGDLARARAIAAAPEKARLVVDVSDRPVTVGDGEPEPTEIREWIRTRGPTVRSDLGKQGGVECWGPAPPAAAPARAPSPVAGLYRYDAEDRQFLRDRAQHFRQQVARRLSGELTEEEFRPFRLMNGLYLQLHGYMLRVAIPYGVMSAQQMRQLAYVAREYDRGYGHFTTRQNIQYNWPRLIDTPDILAVLAEVDIHAIQTSGNCIRNITTDQFAGAAADEIVDPRLYAEILRQWSTDHPEFTFLPRKFKIAITGSPHDRAAVRLHDIGLLAKRNEAGEPGFEVYVGGGLGRTPIVGTKVRDWLPLPDFLRYMEAILRVYNAFGRRDNIYKARIKILVRETKPENFIRMVEDEFGLIPPDHYGLDQDVVDAIAARFPTQDFATLPERSEAYDRAVAADPRFAAWARTNTHSHRQPGYICAVLSLKPVGGIPGDASAEQMDAVADLADRLSFGEIRVTHEQNLVLPHVRLDDLYGLWRELGPLGLDTPNIGLITDIIACPGLDYCALATARSIPVAQRIAEHFADPARQQDIGGVTLNISGCINACGHHHIGNIGILGLDKAGEEFYQITLGGAADDKAAVGAIVGPSFAAGDVVNAIETIIETYRSQRAQDELFIDTYRRVGMAPFKEALYAAHR